MLVEHLAVFECLIEGDPRAAQQALEHHLRRSLGPNKQRLATGERLAPLRPVPFLVAVG
jgi:DNA-binding GntR family transcriptional regulator